MTRIKNNPVIIAQLASFSSFYDALKEKSMDAFFLSAHPKASTGFKHSAGSKAESRELHTETHKPISDEDELTCRQACRSVPPVSSL